MPSSVTRGAHHLRAGTTSTSHCLLSDHPAPHSSAEPLVTPANHPQDNVEDYVGTSSVEPIIKTFQETSAKYRYMELNLQQRRKALLAKIPDIEQTLSVVKFLQARREPKPAAGEAGDKDETGSMNSDDIDALLDGDDEEAEGEGAEQKPLKTLFELNDTLYAEATVQETGEVGLWLGVSRCR